MVVELDQLVLALLDPPFQLCMRYFLFSGDWVLIELVETARRHLRKPVERLYRSRVVASRSLTESVRSLCVAYL
jgi:hypothetical protein